LLLGSCRFRGGGACPAMADEESPYRVEPAKSNRSACKACKEKLPKDELRFGSLVLMGGSHGSYHWRCLKCITGKQAANVEEKVAGGYTKVSGFEELSAKQQAKFEKAFVAAKAGKTDAKKAKAKLAKAKAKAAAKGKAVGKAKAKGKAKGKAVAKVKAKAKGKATAKVKAAAKAKARARAADAAEVLARRGGAPPPPSVDEQHAFLDAAKDYNFAKVRKLAGENYGYVNAQPGGRWSALHQAAAAGNAATIKFLVERGADLDVKTKDGQTPYDVAQPSCKSLLALPSAGDEPPARGR